ncbi:uncharacterized protein LOC133838049 [Drosophila sulfurigaster albostrigata]|uniref:uncharacterized protein LOC133838049 n=1 Tax=Drosophila sulfurigaster albostrigata TaxID=89887 RepID=UPI002D2188E7|nr:uncharacterized protein LOC133838049 [Drosophila sulfurigaster albostrigata]
MGAFNSKSKHKYDVASEEPKPQKRSITAKSNDSQAQSKIVTPDSSPAAAPAAPVPEFDIKLVPTWIKESHFVEILRETVPSFEKIKSFHIKPALNPGENYATLMLRVSLDVELSDKSSKSVSYMMKVPHESPEMEQMLAVSNFFVVENEAYIDLLPKLEKLYKEKGLDIRFAPRAYQFKESVKEEPRLANTVLMYDLGQEGYKNVNRLECLNFEQTKVVLKKMAQYHAAGAHYKNLYGISERLMYGMFGKNIEVALAMLEAMMVPTQKRFLSNLKNFKDCQKYHDKMEAYFGKIKDLFKSIGNHDPNEFNVINHGDSWVNNLLFKIALNGDLSEMLFVDFQNPHYGHPFGDLVYFIMTSVHIDYKLKHFDYFIKYYHDQLIEHLELLEYTERKPKLWELHMQLSKHASWAITAVYMVLPVVLLDPTESATFENFFADTESGSDFKNLMYSNKRYQHYIEQILPWLDNRGLLETYEELPGLTPAAIATESPNQVVINVDPEAPDWVSIDFFKTLLKTEITDYKDIQSFLVRKATEAGDNYSSIMLSVDIDYLKVSGGKSSISFMLKVPPAGAASKTILDLMLTFKKEIAMYYDVIPQLEQLYQHAGEPVVFGPKSYTFQTSPKDDHILLENLRPAGYKNADRLKGLNESETKHVLAKLAKLHAASAQWYVTKGKYADCLDKALHNENTRPIFESEQNKSFMGLAAEAIQKFQGSELYGKKVVKVLDNLFTLISKAEEYDEKQFNVMNHGDCWTNNVMFSYNSQGQIIDTLLIDFQRSNFNTPAQDLYYFLLSSPNFDIKLEKFDYFIRFYHDELKRNLELLKYPRHIPSLRELHIMLLNDSIWAVTTTSTVMSAVLLEPTNNASIETMLGNDEEGKNFKRKLFNNDRYRKHSEAIYPFLNHRGLLDFV